MGDKVPDLETLKMTEWSPEFEKLMRNRLIMGRFRYGPFLNLNCPTHEMIKNAKEKLDKYLIERNTEYLVDVANIMVKVFVTDDHPSKHFCSKDDKNHIKRG